MHSSLGIEYIVPDLFRNIGDGEETVTVVWAQLLLLKSKLSYQKHFIGEIFPIINLNLDRI